MTTEVSLDKALREYLTEKAQTLEGVMEARGYSRVNGKWTVQPHEEQS